MKFVIRRLKELAWEKRIPLYVCFIALSNAYGPVDRTLLWTLLARFGVPQNFISVIPQFHDSMRIQVRLGDGACSGWFAVEQGFCQGCALALLLFNIFVAPVIKIAYTRFKTDEDIMNALEQLRTKRWLGGRKMMGVIVVVCAASGLTYWRSILTSYTYLRTKGMPESTATFSVEAAGQVCNKTNEFVCLGGDVNHYADLPIEVDRRDRALPSSSKS